MIASMFPPPRIAPLDAATGDLVLRIAGSSRDGQIVRLTSAKCTIGAGPHCTLRLRMPGVAPLHCLILRGRAGSVIRRLGADTRLNRHSFTDATLSPGDRVGVGPIELEVVSVGIPTPANDQIPSPCEQQDSWQAEQAEARRQVDRDRNAVEVLRAELESQRNALSEERRQWEAQRAELAAQSEVESQRTAVRLAEAESERQWLDQQRQQWEAQRAESAAQSEVESQRTAVRLAEAESERQWLDQQRQQWQAEQAEARRGMSEERDALAAAQAELNAQRDALVEERRLWEAKLVETPSVVANSDEPIEAVAEAEQSEEAARELQFEETGADAPVNLADVFRRLGAKVDMEGDESEASEPGSGISSPAESAVQRPSNATRAAAKKESEEESVDEYMVRLMKRIRSAEDEVETKPAVSSRASRESARAGEPAALPKPQAAQQRDLAELPPRAAAPEKKIDLSALRELANLSADAAINKHSRRVLVQTMVSKLVVAVVAMLAGGGLLWMWKLAGAEQLTFYSGLLALLIAIYWGVQYALLTGRLIISKSGSIDWNPSRLRRRRTAAGGQSAPTTLPGVAAPSVRDDVDASAASRSDDSGV
jgi:hypothetical protein